MATEGEGDRYRSSFIRKKMQGFKEVSLRGVITVCAEEQVDLKKIDMERNEAGFAPSPVFHGTTGALNCIRFFR